MFCQSCGNELPVEAKVCPKCALALGARGGHGLSFQSASDAITHQLGLERIEGFSLKTFFADVFSRHNPDETENLLIVGSRITTPALQPSMGSLPSPWLFFRVLVGSLLAYAIFVAGWNEYANVNLVPGLIVLGSFAVPFSVLVLFFEINTPKNVSIVRVIQLLVLGGSLSILLSLVLYDVTPMLGVLGASAAGVVEEVGKLAIVLFAIRLMPRERYPYRLNALVFGAAVGAGFAAFESAGYALRIGLMYNGQEMLDTVTLRGAMSPFGHVVWTAIAASAYWIARKDAPTLREALTSKTFLVLFSVPVVLHFVWNLPFRGPLFVKFWVLGFVAWVVVFSLIQSGLKEVAERAAAKQA